MRLSGERALIWAGRVMWAALPVTIGTPLGRAIDSWSDASRSTATLGLWALWLVTLVATLVPHHIALTVWRVMAPAAAAAVVLAAVGGHATIIATVAAAAVVATAFAPAVGRFCVNGPSYANERRYPLRPPGVAVIGLAPVAWLVLVGAPAAAALLLADENWVLGGVVAVVGLALAAVAARSLHGLSRRWLVMVPAGIVVHDPLTLADPVLLPKATIAGIGPAPAVADAPRLDLTGGALGLAMELRLKAPSDVMVIVTPGRRPTAEVTPTTTMLIAPTRAADVLADASARGYRVS